MSDELVKTLQVQVGDLKTELAEARGEAKDRRLKGRKSAEGLAKLTADYKALSLDRDGWKSKAEANQPELAGKVAELEGKLRLIAHKDAFRKEAEAKGLRPEAVDAAWRLSEYKPASDAIDEAAIGAIVVKTAADHPYLLKPAETASTQGGGPTKPASAQVDPLTGVVGGGRGGADAGAVRLRVTAAEYADPGWMDRNAAKVSAASAADLLDVV